ncbi:MAG: PAS domain-containing protein, partial [Myxococcota bacterium]|nr:PAS domain-containing protein [Myxococcota bacterium]
MSDVQGQSLLDFLDVPILVGDPEGNVVFANKAFVRDLCPNGELPQGQPLALLFAGGGREAVLTAVAEVCSTGESVKFRLREAGHGYLALASPIQHEQSRVGVIMQLTDEPSMDSRLLDFHREIQEPLDETTACLEELLEATGGRRHERFRDLVERGTQALVRARKWSEGLHTILCGGRAKVCTESMAPARVLRQVEDRLATEVSKARCRLDLLIDPKLDTALGDPTLLETALVRLLRQRLSDSSSRSVLGLLGRNVEGDAGPGVLISVVDPGTPHPTSGDGDAEEPAADAAGEALAAPEHARLVGDIVNNMGGDITTVSEPPAGRVTSIWLPRP